MSAWGPKLYQDDIADDIRTEYKDQLHRGKTGEEITKELLEKNQELLSDPDDAPIFWFALADTQWNLGRLENHVKEQALYHINDGGDLKRWEEESPREAKIRAKVLEELKQKLLSQQPPEKKISQYRLYHCKWNIGDVYAYQLSGDYAKEQGLAGKYLFFVKSGERSWWPGHTIPHVYIYRIISDRLLSINELESIEYIPQYDNPSVFLEDPDRRVRYALALVNTSSRIIPKKRLTYIGKVDNVEQIYGRDAGAYVMLWKEFEKYIIDDFQKWEGYYPDQLKRNN